MGHPKKEKPTHSSLPEGAFPPAFPESSTALRGQKSMTARSRNKFHALRPAP